MNTFGTIKTKIERVSAKLYKKPEFKGFISELKIMVLENKDISELYYIYDDLSKSKGLPKDIADDYLNETLEYSEILIESSKTLLKKIDRWVSSYIKESSNDYKDIDNSIYNRSIRNLESILESKNRIKKTLMSEEVNPIVKESVILPISTMVKIANDALKKEINNLNENDRKELDEILVLTSDEVKKEMSELKESVVKGLKSTLTESKDGDLNDTIQNTINKIMDSKVDHYNLYKLRKLKTGL
jgi:hypothetical protein